MKYVIKYTVKNQKNQILDNGLADFNINDAKTVLEIKQIVKEWLTLSPSFTGTTETVKLKNKLMNDTDIIPINTSGLSYEINCEVPTSIYQKAVSNFMTGNTSNKSISKKVNNGKVNVSN